MNMQKFDLLFCVIQKQKKMLWKMHLKDPYRLFFIRLFFSFHNFDPRNYFQNCRATIVESFNLKQDILFPKIISKHFILIPKWFHRKGLNTFRNSTIQTSVVIIQQVINLCMPLLDSPFIQRHLFSSSH